MKKLYYKMIYWQAGCKEKKLQKKHFSERLFPCGQWPENSRRICFKGKVEIHGRD